MKTQKNGLFWIFLPLSLILFMSTLDQTVTTTALDGIVKDLGHLDQSSWIITAFMLTSAVMTLIFGKLGDIFGRKIVLQISLAIFILGSLLSGLANSMLFLILTRAFQGIGAGGLNSLVQTITADVVPARSRGKYQALFGLISMVSMIAGPLVGGYFVQYISWQWIFFINVPIGVVASVILALRLKLPKRQVKIQIDYLGSILIATFTTLSLLIVTLGGEQLAWHSTKIMLMIGGAVIALLGYILVENHAKKTAITPLSLFKSGIFIDSILMFAISTGALFVAMVFLPMYVQMIHHVSAVSSGYYIIPTMIAMIVSTMIAGNLIEKNGKYKIYPIIGSVLIGAGFYGLSQIQIHSSNLFIILWQIPIGLGIGLFVQIAMLAGQNAVKVRDLGTATGVLNFFKTMGGAFATAAYGAILTSDLKTHMLNPIHAFQTVFIYVIPIAIVLLVLSLLLKEKPLSEEVLEYED